jgi:DNA topoisomerase VI subunit B
MTLPDDDLDDLPEDSREIEPHDFGLSADELTYALQLESYYSADDVPPRIMDKLLKLGIAKLTNFGPVRGPNWELL